MKPFLSGRPSSGTPALRPTVEGTDTGLAGIPSLASQPGLKSSGSDHKHGPNIECIKQGDKVVRLLITCTCGEKIEVECLYPAAG
ncbi:MAG: hypothetical protein K1X42_10450 [Opitutaceae bacterium]|nr:hypothetical protein [Opitutaceae bacterium]